MAKPLTFGLGLTKMLEGFGTSNCASQNQRRPDLEAFQDPDAALDVLGRSAGEVHRRV